jgi:phosphoenolpyruvate-protein kinase (PTS system EI component)
VDRDSAELAKLFDEQDEAVKWLIREVIREARAQHVKVGLCGQAPSNHPEFARFLVERGIDSVSVTPDSFVAVKRQVATAEADLEQPNTRLRTSARCHGSQYFKNFMLVAALPQVQVGSGSIGRIRAWE